MKQYNKSKVLNALQPGLCGDNLLPTKRHSQRSLSSQSLSQYWGGCFGHLFSVSRREPNFVTLDSTSSDYANWKLPTAVSMQSSHAGSTCTFPAEQHHRPLTSTKSACRHVREQLAQSCYMNVERLEVKLTICRLKLQCPSHVTIVPRPQTYSSSRFIERITHRL